MRCFFFHLFHGCCFTYLRNYLGYYDNRYDDAIKLKLYQLNIFLIILNLEKKYKVSGNVSK